MRAAKEGSEEAVVDCVSFSWLRRREDWSAGLSRRFALKDGGAFVGVELAPLTGSELAQRECANLYPDQAQRGMTDCSRHAADLAIFALDED